MDRKINLRMRQQLPLEIKEQMTGNRVRQWYNYFHGNIYVSFSGGKDSTVLLNLVRKIYPHVPAVFVDTGLEYPEIREFVRTIDNVIWLKPKMRFDQVIEKYGYPVISKKISMGLDRYNNTKSELQKTLRLYGGISPKSLKKQLPTISKKWHFLINAPFKISEKCCYFIKKQPLKNYEKQTNRRPFIGTMASDSYVRQLQYIKNGCSVFTKGAEKSTPIAFWTNKDIWMYIKSHNLKYSKIYDMGEDRTGCMFCMFGIHLEGKNNRFIKMKRSHPKQWDYCINNLRCDKVLDFIGIKYE